MTTFDTRGRAPAAGRRRFFGHGLPGPGARLAATLAVTCTVALAAALALAPRQAAAQAAPWPSKPIRMVVPYTPGGFTDTMARLVGEPLGRALGQPVVFDNKPGANSIIGTDMVAKAAPDGYTLVTVIAAHAVNPSLYPKLPFDTLKDLAQVSLIGVAPVILVANKDFPPSTMQEFIAYAKANPDKLSYGSSGNGAAAHLTMEYLKLATGIKLQHVPYKGTAPALTDMISGQISVMFDTTSSMISHVRAGKIKALGMASDKRLRAATEVPTLIESGVPGFTSSTWAMVLAPAGTPKEIVDRVSSELSRIIRSPAIQEKLDALGVEPGGGTPEEARAFLQAEIAKWGKVVREANVKVDN
jgi:tripartite-type tricarboxylate transporter receptor subunit TctC